jgi:hypothetical protein
MNYVMMHGSTNIKVSEGLMIRTVTNHFTVGCLDSENTLLGSVVKYYYYIGLNTPVFWNMTSCNQVSNRFRPFISKIRDEFLLGSADPSI